MSLLGEVAVGIVSDASGFATGAAAAIDQGLTAPLAAAQAQATQTVAAVDKLGSTRGPDLSKAVKDTANLSTGVNAAARAIDQLDLGVEGLGQTVQQVSSGISAGGLLGLATGVVAVVSFALAQAGKMEKQIKQNAEEIAATIADTNATFAELEANLDRAFTPQQQAQLEEYGFDLRAVTTDAETFKAALEAIRAEQDRGEGLGGIGDSLIAQNLDAILEELADQYRVTAEEAALSAQRQREAAESIPGRVAAAVDRIVSEWDRIHTDADRLRGDLEADFSGWVDVLQGVPDQVAVTAEEIAANSQAILEAAAQQMDAWVQAVEAGAPNVAQAILDAGPEANAAFAELLNNPALLTATEQALQRTSDLTKQLVDEHVTSLVDPQLETLFRDQLSTVGQEGMRGLGAGLEAESPAIAARLRSIMQGFITQAYEVWGVKSPAKEFIPVGRGAMEGIGGGLVAGSSGVSAQLQKELDTILASATPTVRRGGRNLGKAMAEELSAALAEWGANLRLVEVTRALEDARAEVTRLGQTWTASEIVAVERAEEHLAQLLETRGEVAQAERDIAAAQTVLAAAEQARRAAAQRWDFDGFQAAERMRDDAQKQIEEAQRILNSRVASDAEIALAQQEVTAARESPEQARFDAALAAERATLAAFQQQLSQGADIAALLRQVAGRPQQVEVTLNLAYSGDPGEMERIGREAANAVVRQLVDAIGDR